MVLKRLLLSFLILLGTSCNVFGNVVPASTVDIPQNSIGLYQTDRRIVVHESPGSDSKVLLDKQLNYSSMLGAKTDNMFAVLVPDKELGYLYVIDADEDWIKVIYDKSKNLSGWVYKNDDFQFLPWGNFYNMYGRKYGLLQLKNSPIGINDIHSAPDENSQMIGKMTRPKQIRLTSIEGNWALVSILDVTCYTSTGYVQWRNINGEFYLFPAIK